MQSLRQLLIAILCLLAGALPAAAAQFTVNSTADVVDDVPGDGFCATAPPTPVCTLRAAIQEANALQPGPHTITLPAGTYTLTIPQAFFPPGDASGDLDINTDLTINGAGPATTIIEASRPVSGNPFRVFSVYSLTSAVPITAGISGVTIRNGFVNGDGGGIANSATLHLTDVIITGNQAGDVGGGIRNIGTVTLTRSTVSGNIASVGGGIDNQRVTGLTAGEMTITNSTISGNSSSFVGTGGIRNNVGVVTITNSTISGNSSSSFLFFSGIGGIENFGGVMTITNSTISGNSSSPFFFRSGTGGILTQTIDGNPPQIGVVTIKNTIIAGNVAPLGSPDCFIGVSAQGVSAQIDSLGHNLVGDDSGCSFPHAAGDQVGTAASPVAPLLGTLADNGGPTPTHALLGGSPAINAGDNGGCPTTDQRGVTRPQESFCDIGAFEFIQPVATLATSAGQFSNLSAVPESILPTTGKPAGLAFPFGFFSWTVTDLTPGQQITVTITYPTSVSPGAQYWKVTGGTWTNVTSLLGNSNTDGDNSLSLTITDGGPGDSDSVVNGQISDPGGVGVASTVAFASFRPEVEIKLHGLANNHHTDKFEVEAFFTLGAGNNGIAPLNEALTLEVGPYTTTIPAGSFKQKKGRFKFEGIIDGVKLTAKIQPLPRGGFKFKAVGKCADLTGTVNPVTVGLTIGNDSGRTNATAEIESGHQRAKCGDRRDDAEDDKDDKDDKDDD